MKKRISLLSLFITFIFTSLLFGQNDVSEIKRHVVNPQSFIVDGVLVTAYVDFDYQFKHMMSGTYSLRIKATRIEVRSLGFGVVGDATVLSNMSNYLPANLDNVNINYTIYDNGSKIKSGSKSFLTYNRQENLSFDYKGNTQDFYRNGSIKINVKTIPGIENLIRKVKKEQDDKKNKNFAKRYKAEGDKLYKNRSYSSALAKYKKASKLDPTNYQYTSDIKKAESKLSVNNRSSKSSSNSSANNGSYSKSNQTSSSSSSKSSSTSNKNLEKYRDAMSKAGYSSSYERKIYYYKLALKYKPGDTTASNGLSSARSAQQRASKRKAERAVSNYASYVADSGSDELFLISMILLLGAAVTLSLTAL